MKDVCKYLVLLVVCTLCFTNKSVAQFTFALYPETDNPAASGTADRAYTVNAYSESNITMDQGGVYTLNIHAWNSADPYSLMDGIAGEMFNGTTTMPCYTQLDSILSVDLVLTQSVTDSVYALLTYYSNKANQRGHWIKTFLWDETTNSLTAVDSTQLSTDTVFNWIHIDANELDSFVVTWASSINNRIYMRAGQTKNVTGSYPQMAPGGEVTLNDPNGLRSPDIAISNAASVGQRMAHITYLDPGSSKLFEGKMTLNDIYINGGGALAPTIEDTRVFPFMELPRIDCPDHSFDDDWASVVLGRAGSQAFVLSSINSAALSSAPQQFTINDASLGHLDLTPYKAQFGPVVAYDRDYKHLIYAWQIFDAGLLAPYGTTGAYIGLEMERNGALQDSRYWFIQTNIPSVSPEPAMALSGQNDQSDMLYMSFGTLNSSSQYHVSYKSTPWGSPTNSFRPGHTGVGNITGLNAPVVFPNPFKSGFMLFDEQIDESEIVSAELSDVNGKSMLYIKGTMNEINRKFSKVNIAAGLYNLNVNAKTIHRNIKVVKE